MDLWLGAALDYIPSWLDYQIEQTQQPGCLLAIVHRGRIVLEHAVGMADIDTGEKLTPRHRFRIASHSKSFTAAGILRLRDQGKLRLDDPVGTFIDGLHRKVARATLAQILSHTAGFKRDGDDAGAFEGRRPFVSAAELKAEFSEPPVIDAGVRLKYSNRGYSLLGLVIEAVTGEPYEKWMAREVIAAAGLKETTPDMPLPSGARFARGHTLRLPLGRRLVVPGTYRMEAVASAGGFVSTAADTALFFNQLSPDARHSILSAASRREMTHRLWRNPHALIEGYYGLGLMCGTTHGWNWFGHGGSLLGYISRTLTVPDIDLTVSAMTNVADGWAQPWSDGILSILRTFRINGPPARRVAGWTGRWWGSFGAYDLVPMGDKVLVASPLLVMPFAEATEIAVTARDSGQVALASGYGSHGEAVRRVRSSAGRVTELWIGASRAVPRARAATELKRRLGARRPTKRR